MNKWIAEFELEDGDTMPEHMDLNYKEVKIDFHCKPLEQEPIKSVLEDIKAEMENLKDNRCFCHHYERGINDCINVLNKHMESEDKE